MWLDWLKSWKELGINLKEIPEGQMASYYGPVPVDGGELLPYLIARRRIIEGGFDLSVQSAALVALDAEPRWRAFWDAHNAAAAVREAARQEHLGALRAKRRRK